MSSAAEGEAECFAVRRGDTHQRLDCHYHLPEYRALLATLRDRHSRVVRLDSVAEVVCGPFGSEIKASDYREVGVPLLRISDIKEDGTIDETGLVYLDEAKANSLASTQVEPGDLVISQRGTVGISAIVPDSHPVWNISANLIAVTKITKVSAPCVQLILSCRAGAKQLERNRSGQVQGKVTTEDVASVLIPLPPPGIQRALVAEMEAAREAHRRRLEEADALLTGIDAYLLAQLGLAPPPREQRPAFAVNLARLRSDERLNPEYFHPERQQAVRAILAADKSVVPVRIKDVANFVRDAEQVSCLEEYIGLGSVQRNTGELIESFDEDAQGQAFRFMAGDVLFCRLRPYLNKVHKAERNGICSTEFHVIRVRPTEKLTHTVLPDYLAAVLRSSVVVAQTTHMMTGNTHPRLSNADVVNLLIPVPSPGVQERIVAVISKRRADARRLRAEAAAEWEAAKARFEEKLLGRRSG